MNQKVLELKDITKEYGDFRVLDGLSLEVVQGQRHGILGPNGAGKTTTLNIINGILEPTSGDILFYSKDMTTKQLDIGYLPENLPLYNGLTVEQYLSFCSEIRGKNFNPQQFKDSFWHYLDISPLLKKNIGKLSRGQKQRVALVQSFLHQPKLVVLDEPTLGLDPQGIQNFKKFLKEISNEVSIIITGHVLSEMQSMCDHISILSQGKILKSIELKELSRYQTDFADLVLPKMEKISFDQLLDNDLQELQVEYEERMDDLVKMRLNFQKYTEDPKDFLSRLNKEKIQATEFSFVKNTLEEYYFGLNI